MNSAEEGALPAGEAAAAVSTAGGPDKSTVPVTRAATSVGDLGRQDFQSMLALLTAAFVFRLYSLQFFHVIATDGTSYVQTARHLAKGDWQQLGVFGFYPVLITVAGWFIADGETAGRMVSVVCGSLLIIPLYLLGREFFSRSVAVAACLVVTVWSPFVGLSCEVITQATYIMLKLTAIYCVWRAFDRPTIVRGLLAGLLIGLSFFTRPEAILLSLTLPMALSCCNLRELRTKQLFYWSYAAGFLVIFAFNMLLVHQASGEWQLSAKTDSALNDALSYYLNLPDMGYVPGYVPKTYLDIIREYPGFIWKNSLDNLQTAWEVMLPLPFWLLAMVGFLANGFDKEMNRQRLFLLATFAPLAVIIVFYYIVGGYCEAYLPVLLLFAAAGFVEVERRCKKLVVPRLPEGAAAVLARTPLLLVAATIYAVTLLAPQIRPNVTDADYRPDMDDGRRSEKHIGRLLKENLPPGKIMTRWARIAFYAEREWVTVPAGINFDQIIKFARDSGARYLIADGMLYGSRPAFGMELFRPFLDKEMPYGLLLNTDPKSSVKGLHPLLIYTAPNSVGVIVYEIPPA